MSDLPASAFDPAAFGPTVAALLAVPRQAPLGPGSPNLAMRPRLEALTPEEVFAPRRVTDTDAARACLAGLWLYHDFLDESHSLSQELHTAEGSYWHGLMHRREPDFSNSKYWFRHVGTHAVFEPLCADAAKLAAGAPPQAAFLTRQIHWDPFAFIDLCEASHTGRTPCAMLCRQIQQREWELVFDHCYQAASGQGH